MTEPTHIESDDAEAAYLANAALVQMVQHSRAHPELLRPRPPRRAV